MRELEHLFKNNRDWANRLRFYDPEFFHELAEQQSPDFLWIGCSDSRVPANDIVGLMPGELFVHRNVANLMVHDDINSKTVLQFAVEVLKVRHIIVCGHYGCSGVRAAMEKQELGDINHWLHSIHTLHCGHEEELSTINDEERRLNRLCELNVIEQVNHVSSTKIVQNAWHREQELMIHGWIYSIRDGYLHDLHVSVSGSTAMTRRDHGA